MNKLIYTTWLETNATETKSIREPTKFILIKYLISTGNTL